MAAGHRRASRGYREIIGFDLKRPMGGNTRPGHLPGLRDPPENVQSQPPRHPTRQTPAQTHSATQGDEGCAKSPYVVEAVLNRDRAKSEFLSGRRPPFQPSTGRPATIDRKPPQPLRASPGWHGHTPNAFTLHTWGRYQYTASVGKGTVLPRVRVLSGGTNQFYIRILVKQVWAKTLSIFSIL